jgi:ubiquinone/menaquinone biosynthesis C-methylase UbiE
MKRKNVGDTLSGKGREYIPNLAFRIMTFIMKLMDVLARHSDKNFTSLGLSSGNIVVDYGCGPARYILNASKTVGDSGKVYAVDIHPMAIKKVKNKINKHKLKNVKPILANGYHSGITDKTIDVVYALDMFHMITNPDEVLKEFARIIKPNGRIIIEDGHQPRSETRSKIFGSSLFKIENENKNHVVCKLKEI